MADDILEQVFSASDEDTETFAEVVEQARNALVDDTPVPLVKTAKYIEEKQEYIQIKHGTHEEDYVWHILPWHPKKNWAVPLPRVIYAIGAIFHKRIPHTVLIDIYPPDPQWEVKEITIKANDAMGNWSVTDADIKRTTVELFEVLNTLV